MALLAAVFALALYASPSDAQSIALGQLVPLRAWAVLWTITAIVCVAGAFAVRDQMAFGLAVASMTLWSALYFVAWAIGFSPRGWLAGTIYLAFAAFLVLLSTWAEPRSYTPALQLDTGYPDAFIAADRNGVITSWWGGASRLFGWDEQHTVGQPITMLMPRRFRADHLSAYARVRAGEPSRLAGRTVEMTALHREGHEFPIRLFLSANTAATGPMFTAVIRASAAERS